MAEDDALLRQLLANALRADGCEVIEARDGAELARCVDTLVLQPAEGEPVDLIITDLRMPVVSGLEVLGRLRCRDWATPVILITAFGDQPTHVEATRLGAAVILDKPFDVRDLRSAVRRLLQVP